MVRIVTETTCDLSLEDMKELGVEHLAMKVTMDGQEYADREDITPKEFFAKLEAAEGVPTTAQITPAEYERIMNDVKEKGEQALFAVFSSELSGSYQAAVVASRSVDYEGIRVVDTRAASGGQGLIVYRLARMAQAGASLGELEEKARWMSEHIEHLVLVDSLEMLKKGGRVSATAAFMGGMLNIKPLLHLVDGKLVPFEKAKGSKKGIRRLVEELGKRGKGLDKQVIFLSHADNEEGVEVLKQEIRDAYGIDNFYVTELGATIGTHTGRGVLAFFFFNEEE